MQRLYESPANQINVSALILTPPHVTMGTQRAVNIIQGRAKLPDANGESMALKLRRGFE